MILQTLFQRHTWDDVLPVLINLYPDQKRNSEKYEKVWKQLQTLFPEPASKMTLVFQNKYDEIEQESYTDVFCKKENQKYAFDFCPWEELLGMGISEHTLETYSGIEILAHCLWEMTWHGFDQESIQERENEMSDGRDEGFTVLDEI